MTADEIAVAEEEQEARDEPFPGRTSIRDVRLGTYWPQRPQYQTDSVGDEHQCAMSSVRYCPQVIHQYMPLG